MKKLILSLIALLLAAPVAAQDFRHRYFHYDQIYTDPDNSLLIGANTIDGADSKQLVLCGGGYTSTTACGRSRGAFAQITGNEFSGGAGYIDITAGNAATGHIYFKTGDGYTRLTIPYLADADDVDLVLGSAATTAPIFTIRGQTIDGDDDGTLRLAAGGGAGDWGRGSYINLYGNEKATTGGDMELSSGVSSGNDIRFLTASSIRLQILGLGSYNDNEFIIGNSAQTASVSTIHSDEADGSDDLTLQLTAGGSSTVSGTRGAWIEMQGQDVGGANAGGDIAVYSGAGSNAAKPIIRIANQTVDGSDWGAIELSAGSSTATNRGAYLQLHGNEGATTGYIGIVSGSVANVIVDINASNDTGQIRFGADSTTNVKWSIPGTASATTSSLKFGANSAQTHIASIFSNRDTDGTDDDVLQLCAGGACGSIRGAGFYLYGNEAGGTGSAQVESGNAAGSIVRITSNGQIQLRDYSGYNSSVNVTGVDCEAITIAVGSGAAGVTSATNLCASGTILGLGARVTDAPGGGATTFDVGCTGSGNLDQFCDGVSSALNTTCAYPTNGDGTNTPWVQKTATTMTVTTDANVTTNDMIVRVCPYYFDTTAPTS